MSEFQIQIKLEFQMRGYLKLKCLNFNFSQIGSSVTRLSEIKMSEFKFRYLKIVSEFGFQSTFPEIPASEFEIQSNFNFSHNIWMILYCSTLLVINLNFFVF